MKRMAERYPRGREAPIVIGPRAIVRLIVQTVGAIRRMRRD
jgi:hypothetical protein